MNSKRPEALPVKWNWRPALLYVFFFLGCAPLIAATHKNVRKNQGVQTDVLPAPDQQQTPAKDLLLKPEDEKKADALAYYIDGSIAEDNADVDRALDDYRKVLDADPAAKVRTDDDNNTPMLLAAKVAFELARRGDPGTGIDILKDTAKAAPNEPTTYYFLAQLYSRFLRKYDVALKYADQALGLDGSNFIFLLTDYEILVNLGQNKKAVDVLDRASKIQNTDPQFWLKLGELYIHALVKDDNTNTPIAPDDLKKLNALFQKTLALAKDDPAVIAKIADYYVLTKQIKDAVPLYKQVLDLKPVSDAPLFTDVREKLASAYIATGRRDEAIKALEALVKANPLRAGTYEMLGQLYVDKGEYDKALNSYRQTLLLTPNRWQNYLVVSDIMFQLKKYNDAVELLKETRKKFPDQPRVTYALAQALSLAKKHQEAMTVFQEAQAEAQNSESELLDADFFFNYGAAAEQAGLVDKAADLFKKSIEMDPSNAARAYNYLGFMWVDRGEHLDEAGTMIKRAVEMEPDNGAYIDSLGWYYYKKGEPQKALDQLLKAANSIKPEDAVVYDHIGDTYEKLGNTSQALDYWQKSLALDPDNKQITEKIEGAKQKVTSATTPAPEKPAEH